MHLYAPVAVGVVGMSVHECVRVTPEAKPPTESPTSGMSRPISQDRKKAVSRQRPRGAQASRCPGRWAPAPAAGGPQPNSAPTSSLHGRQVPAAPRPRQHVGKVVPWAGPACLPADVCGLTFQAHTVTSRRRHLRLYQRTQHQQAPWDPPFPGDAFARWLHDLENKLRGGAAWLWNQCPAQRTGRCLDARPQEGDTCQRAEGQPGGRSIPRHINTGCCQRNSQTASHWTILHKYFPTQSISPRKWTLSPKLNQYFL